MGKEEKKVLSFESERELREQGPCKKAFLSPEEAANVLGVSLRYVYDLLKAEVLPRVKLGKRTLVPVDVVRALKVKALAEGTFSPGPRWWLRYKRFKNLVEELRREELEQEEAKRSKAKEGGLKGT